MPLVTLCVDFEVVGANSTIRKITEFLPAVVANALDIPSNPKGRLTAWDIEIQVRPKHPLDVSFFPISIIIQSHDFPERRENLKDRCEKIANWLKSWNLGHEGFVWIVLSPTAFATF